MRSLTLLAFGVAISLLVVMAILSTEGDRHSASAACTPPRGHVSGRWYAGWYRQPGTTVGGVYSKIKNYYPYVYPNTSTTAWVMLTTPNLQNHAQVGWYKEQPSVGPPVWAVFREWTTVLNNPNSYIRKLHFVNPTIGGYDYYTVLYGNTPGKFTFLHKGVTIGIETAAFVPSEGQNYGETKSRASQMPGGYNSHEEFNDTNIWYPAGGGGSWKAVAGLAGATEPGIHAASMLASRIVNIWDKSCAT